MSPLDKRVVVMLAAGFTLVILLMLAIGKLGLDALQELGRGSTGLLTEERESGRALADAQELETAFDQLFYGVPGARPVISGEALESRLRALEAALTRAPSPERTVKTEHDAKWREFQAAGLAFVQVVRHETNTRAPGSTSHPDAVAAAHRRVLDAVHELVVESDLRNQDFVARDRDAFANAVGTSIRLLAVTGGIAVIVAVATVFLVQRLLAHLAWQRSELSRLSSDILHTQEDTLRQVSHDLHDHIGQTLTAIEANLGALESASQDWAIRGRVEDCIGLVQDLMTQTRSMSQLLRPSVLDDFGLSASLESLADSYRQRTGTDVRFTSNASGRLHEHLETHLYRIAQEALTNVARHSAATAVDLTLTERGSVVELHIEDNGHGLPKPAAEARGVGLRSMRARAREINGAIELSTRPGGGLRVVVRAPLVRAEHHEPQDAIAAR